MDLNKFTKSSLSVPSGIFSVSYAFVFAILPLVSPAYNPNKSPSYLVYKHNRVCLRADFRASLEFSYIDKKWNDESTEVHLPPVINATGMCEAGERTLILRFKQDAVYVTLNFRKFANGTWSASEARVTFNTKDHEFFKDQGKDQVYTAKTSGTLFTAKVNTAYTCKSDQHFILKDESGKEKHVQVLMTMYNTEIQPFDIIDGNFSNETTTCGHDVWVARRKTLIPLVMAGCLASVIVMIAIGFVIVRRGKISYAAMD